MRRMKTENETLEKILDLGLPKGYDQPEYRRKFKFMVTFKVAIKGVGKPKETNFSYYDLGSARKCYRDILLALYRGKDVGSFTICLNHYGAMTWQKPIFLEAVDDNGQ
jgi:hypothetical protein